MIDPFNLRAFLAFAESKPAHETYDPGIASKCALGQFVKSLGGMCIGNQYIIDKIEYSIIDDGCVAYELSICNGVSTFGALASRIRAFLKVDAPKKLES